MPTHQSTWKRLRQDKVRRLRNRMVKSRVRTYIKKILIGAESQSVSDEQLQALLRESYQAIDRAARKRIIRPNTAARQKSRIARMVNKRGSAQQADADNVNA